MSVMHFHAALQPKMQSAPAVVVTINMVMDVRRIPVRLRMLPAHIKLVLSFIPKTHVFPKGQVYAVLSNFQYAVSVAAMMVKLTME